MKVLCLILGLLTVSGWSQQTAPDAGQTFLRNLPTGALWIAGTEPAVVTQYRIKLTNNLPAYGGTALTNTAGLSYSVTNGIYYWFKFTVLFESTNTTTGLALALSVPAFTTFSARSDIPIAADGTAAMRVGWHTNSNDSNIGTAVQSSNTVYVAIVEGVLLPSADGTLQLRHASEVASSAVWVKKGSLGLLSIYP